MPKYIVDLYLDGYDNEEEAEKAGKEFIEDQLNMTASGVKVLGQIKKNDRNDRTFILFNGPQEVVEKQLMCNEHDWYGPCRDSIARYYKCTKCYCLEYDCTWEEYVKEFYESDEKRSEVFNIVTNFIDDLQFSLLSNKISLTPYLEESLKNLLKKIDDI